MHRQPKLITYEGETMSVSRWAKRMGILPSTLFQRLKKMPAEEALTKPVSEQHRKNALGKHPNYKHREESELTPSGKKPHRTVWKEMYDSIIDNEMYNRTILALLTSGGTAARALANGEIYIHKYEGGVQKIKGYDIKQWLLKKNYQIKPKPVEKEVKYVPKEIKVPSTKPALKLVPTAPAVLQSSHINWHVMVIASAIIGAVLGWTLNFFKVL